MYWTDAAVKSTFTYFLQRIFDVTHCTRTLLLKVTSSEMAMGLFVGTQKLHKVGHFVINFDFLINFNLKGPFGGFKISSIHNVYGEKLHNGKGAATSFLNRKFWICLTVALTLNVRIFLP